MRRENFKRVVFVIFRRRRAVGIVEGQDNFRPVAGRAHGGAGEDHRIHAVAAQRLGRGCAHYPAQRFQQVGLAAAIGADNAGKPVADFKIGRLYKGFKPDKADIGKLHKSFPDSSN